MQCGTVQKTKPKKNMPTAVYANDKKRPDPEDATMLETDWKQIHVAHSNTNASRDRKYAHIRSVTKVISFNHARRSEEP